MTVNTFPDFDTFLRALGVDPTEVEEIKMRQQRDIGIRFEDFTAPGPWTDVEMTVVFKRRDVAWTGFKDMPFDDPIPASYKRPDRTWRFPSNALEVTAEAIEGSDGTMAQAQRLKWLDVSKAVEV